MRRLILMFLFFVFASSIVHAQNKITGIVKDRNTQKNLSGVEVRLLKTNISTLTDANGYYELNNVPSGAVQIYFSLVGYHSFIQVVENTESTNKNIGYFYMTSSDITIDNEPTSENSNSEDETIVDIDDSEFIEGYDDLDVNVSGVLHGSKDVFMSTAGYTLGPLRFSIRGYENKYSDLYMNGIQTNDMESGRAVWAYWGGLNDAVRNKEAYKGISNSDIGFGGVGGITGIDTRASKIRTGTKLTYSFTNRSYNHRAMFIHSTGMMKNGLAVAVSGSRRYAKEGYVEGTFYDAWAYFLSVEKKINDKHSIGFVGFGAPSKRGGRSATTQEVYDLTSTRYNPNWGWQNGKKRNAKVGDSHTPFGILTHYWNINKSSKLETSFAYSKGKYNKTSLNWYNANDPRPDYYRYLPSYYATKYGYQAGDSILRRNEFLNGERQIDWNLMYQTNYNSIDTIENADNISGNTLIGKRSQYIIEDRRNENNQFWFSTNFNKQVNENLKVVFGAQHRRYKSRHYKTLVDLLGGDFIVDVDKYAQRDLADLYGEEVAESDIRHPNNIIDEIGEVFGNDYYSNVNKTQAWIKAQMNIGRIDVFGAINGSNTNFWRTGNMQNGKFPNNSLGNSEKLSFINYGAKAGFSYKLSGKQHIRGKATYFTKAPDFRNSFVSPRTRNQVISGLESETIYSGEIGYIIQSNKFKATFDAFYTEINNQSSVRSFYLDISHSFLNFVMSNVDKTYQGIELGAEYTIVPGLSAYGVGSLGYYRWASNPNFNVYIDNSASLELENEKAFIKGNLVGGTPQTAFSAGIKYFSYKYIMFGVNVNYLDDRYLPFSALTRATSSLEGFSEQDRLDPRFKEFIKQDKLPASLTLDAFIGKSFRFDYKYYLNISLNVSNILNNTQIRTGGYEQARFVYDLESLERFPPKYYYYSGLQYYLNVSFRF